MIHVCQVHKYYSCKFSEDRTGNDEEMPSKGAGSKKFNYAFPMMFDIC